MSETAPESTGMKMRLGKEQAEAAFALSKQHLDAALHYSTLRGQVTLSNVAVTGVLLSFGTRAGSNANAVSLSVLFLFLTVFFGFLVFKIGQAHTGHWRKYEAHRKNYERYYKIKEPIHAQSIKEFDSEYFIGRGRPDSSFISLFRIWQIANMLVPLLALLALLLTTPHCGGLSDAPCPT